MKVYIDIFFFVNFLMNLQVFQILNYWRRKPAVSARSIAGAGLGALLGVLVVILGIRTRWILWILVYAAGTSILIRFVYGKMNFRGHLRCVVGFYLTAAAVSGTLFGIREFLGLHSISLVFLLGGSIGIQLAAGAVRRTLGNRMPEQYMYETRLIWHGKSVQGTGFFDTGNRLVVGTCTASVPDMLHIVIAVADKSLIDHIRRLIADGAIRGVHDRQCCLFHKIQRVHRRFSA